MTWYTKGLRPASPNGAGQMEPALFVPDAAGVPPAEWHAAAQLLYREAEILDAGRLKDWLALIAPELDYRLLNRAQRTRPDRGKSYDPDSFIIACDRAALEARITRQSSEWAWSEETPAATRRFITNVRVEHSGDDLLVTSNLLLFRAVGRRCLHLGRAQGSLGPRTHGNAARPTLGIPRPYGPPRRELGGVPMIRMSTASPDVERMLDEMDAGLDRGEVPLRIYGDEEIYRLECERIFARCWNYLAHESEIPDPGDYVLRYIVDAPFIVSRDGDGRIHVLFDSCRHRGPRVCQAERGNTSRSAAPTTAGPIAPTDV